MFLFYYDEVKLNPPDQRSFWLGGIGVESNDLREIEDLANNVAREVFGHARLERGTEFHGKEIFQGKGAFKGVEPGVRLIVLGKLIQILKDERVVRFYIRINPENFVFPQDPEETAFMFLAEKIQQFLENRRQVGMLFGDFDEPIIGPTVASLSRFREGGTYWSRASIIDRLIDTVHFAKSHHSRMIQLADVFLYCRQFYALVQEGYWKQRFNEVIKDSGVYSCHFQKSWPGERKWYPGA